MRYAYWKVFERTEDGRLRTRWPLKLNGVTLRAGDSICAGVFFAGFNPHRVEGRDLEAYSDGTGLVLQAIYHHQHGRGDARPDRKHAETLPRRPDRPRSHH